MFLANEKVFANYFKGAPLSVILEDSFSTGFLIKTYHHKYKVIRAFRGEETIIVRTSKKFWKKNLRNKGMSIFRRKERSNKASTTVMPPGAIFVGDLAYGNWVPTDYGSKEWKFHRTYKHYPEMLNWGEFRPNIDFYQRMRIFESDGSNFYGPNNEFGVPEGAPVDTTYKEAKEKILTFDVFKNILKNYLDLPPWNSNE
jgi:hypothetical protein